MTAATEPRVISIKWRLLGLLLVPLTVLLGLGLFIDYRTGVASIGGVYDRALGETALAIAAHLRDANGDGHIDFDLPPQAIAALRTRGSDTVAYAVRRIDGVLVDGDADLGFVLPASEQAQLFDAKLRGKPVRVAVHAAQVDRTPLVVAVAVSTHQRDSALRRILASIVLTDLIQLIGTLALVWIGVRHGLRPLRNLGEQIAQRSARDLAPLQDTAIPAEVRPLVHTLNALFDTVRGAARAQQQFTADAAHQLRTPLSGIIAQLEVLEREPVSAELRERLLALHGGCVRLAHTAHQLLTLARSEPSAITHEDYARVDLEQLVTEAVSHSLDRALDAGLDFGAECAPAQVLGNPWLLREMLGNLVDNALAYTPRGGRVTLRCGDDGCAGWLEVEDDGAGIAVDLRAQVRERFVRLPGSPGNGCGLGLAIVDEIARAHEAEFSLDSGSNGRGTRARVRFRHASAEPVSLPTAKPQ